ncbi:CpaD family pilus assembly protein [Sphingomonas aracearum]|uniref:Pilus assembly protein CpaD n=1 Tax=Sphingomonas aracearum TaxID=2283317 RepID=A0A369VWE9_9SPHN|nr:CpaD family pilus assembly protein [Sphingomonas aracearum]RDE06716.1 pilus assembly protein CpaD [Sphingomonas aracearum]
MTKRPILLASTLLAALAVSGCSGTRNRGLESVHQPVVSRSDFVFDAQADAGGLAPGEDQRLAGWLAGLRLGYGDRVSVDDSGNGAARARDDVAQVTARYGLLIAEEAPTVGAPIAPGTVRVIVTRSRATVPGCPDFSRVRQPEYEGNTSSNFGCATNSNLALMVANPTDLVRGQAGAEAADPATSTRAIGTYRRAAPTGAGGTTLRAESTGNK